MLNAAQRELAGAPVQREASELRLGRVRRKDFHFPAAQVVDQPAQLQPDFHVLCRDLEIVVEQVENESPTVGFSSQLAQHVTARLQTEARPSCSVFGARHNSRLRLSGPDDDAPASGERIQPRFLLGAELGQVSWHDQHLEPVQGEVVMSCDIVIAAEGTTFAITPAKLGVPYDIEGTLSFMQSVSLPVIKEMLFTAQPMPADRALRVGLINQVVPTEHLESATTEMARYMIQNSPLVISLLKEQLRVLGEAHPLNPEGFQRIQAIRRRIYDSADYQEGIRSFFERRAPQFQGR